MKHLFRRIAFAAVCLTVFSGSPVAATWQKQKAPLMTPWGEALTADNVWAEYPRPSMVRPAWMNLNGVWGYFKRGSVNYAYERSASSFRKAILVPFPVESALSGIMDSDHRANTTSTHMYRRTFTLPSDYVGKHVLLHFGAVDWRCSVYVNGQLVGSHDGGSDPFSFDITAVLNTDGEQEVQVAVWDPSDRGGQPIGKQSITPNGIWYTASSGIWQTVWLEPVQEAHILSYEPIPDIDATTPTVSIKVNASVPGTDVHIVVKDAGRVVAQADGRAGDFVTLDIPEAKLWSPDNPNLYDLELTLSHEGQQTDQVRGYFGMRKFSRGMVNGRPCVLLNNQPIYLYGPLDQGWWPDGLLTPPSYEAMVFDLQAMKDLGMNMVRKHIKVENDLWFDWCDRHGLVVWQDMINGGNPGLIGNKAESQQNFYRECGLWIEATRHHPCIGAWVVYNEAWGQDDGSGMQHTRRGVENVIALNHDPGRFVHAVTGWTDIEMGDFIDVHSYPAPGAATNPINERVASCGEFGGINLFYKEHMWSGSEMDYITVPDANYYTVLYNTYTDRLQQLQHDKGLWMSVYTQITDVEQECNGIYTYDRKLLKVSDAQKALMRAGILRTIHSYYQGAETLVPAGDASQQRWQYTTSQPAADWFATDFDASSWKNAYSGFGGGGRTTWSTSDIWLRRTFQLQGLTDEQRTDLRLWLFHDEDAEIYINGQLACVVTGYNTSYEQFPLLPEGLQALKLDGSDNVLAIHCRQTAGGQFIDCGLKLRKYVDDNSLEVSAIPATTPVPQFQEGEEAYLMAYTNASSSQPHYAYSLDGATWLPLNGNRGIMQGDFADLEVIAPFIRAVDTDSGREFHLLGELSDHSKPGLYHWVSTDLINWQPVAEKHIVLNTNTTAKAVAPEWIYDEDSQTYYLYWTCEINGKSTIYYSTTKDWQRFTSPRQYFDPGTSAYDIHIERMGQTYYAFFYTENQSLCVSTSSSLQPSKGKFGAPQRLFASGVYKVRAPQTYPALGGDGWFLATLNTNGTGPSLCASGDPSELKWYSQNEDHFQMPSDLCQGSVVTITRDELRTLMRAYSFEEYNLLPTAETEGATWKYITTSVSSNWTSPNFNDDNWREGRSGFGAGNPPNSVTNTAWTSGTIRLRHRLDLSGFTPEQLRSLEARIYHDEDVTVYFNGVVAFQETGYLTAYKGMPINPEALAALTPDADNVVAIECRNAGGGQYIDFGLTAIRPTTVGVLHPAVTTPDAPTGIYNLQGQRLPTLRRGINIVNGNKVIVK